MKTNGIIWAGLHVEDMEREVAFFRDILSMPVLGRGDGWAHLDAGGGTLFELFEGGKASSDVKRPQEQPLEVGFRVGNLDRAIAELRDKAVQFVGEIGQGDSARWIHFRDPEGNNLEIKEVRE